MTFVRLMFIAVIVTVALDIGWSYFRPAPPMPEATFAEEALLDQTAPPPTHTVGAPTTIITAEDEMKAAVEGETSHSFATPVMLSLKDDVATTTQHVAVQIDALRQIVPSGGAGVKGAFYTFAHAALDEADLFIKHVNTRWFRSDGSLDMNAVLEPPVGKKELPSQPPMTLPPLKQ